MPPDSDLDLGWTYNTHPNHQWDNQFKYDVSQQIRYLRDKVNRGGVRTATRVVAASDASDRSKQQCDYLCNGTNDGVEIQIAADYISSVGGGILLLTEGTYYIKMSDVITLPDNIVLKGYGIGATKLKLSDGESTNGNIIANSGTSRIAVMDLTIDGNTSGTSGQVKGIYFGGVAHCTIRNVRVYDMESDGITIYSSSSYILVENCEIDTCEKGLSILNAVAPVNVVGNSVYNCDDYGIELRYTSYFIMCRNTVKNNNATGVYIGSCEFSQIEENIITYNSTGIGLHMRFCHRLEVTNNYIAFNGYDGIKVAGDGTLNSTSNISILHNFVVGNSQATDQGYCNVVIACGKYHRVCNNDIREYTPGSKHPKWGIWIQSNTYNVTVAHNSLCLAGRDTTGNFGDNRNQNDGSSTLVLPSTATLDTANTVCNVDPTPTP